MTFQKHSKSWIVTSLVSRKKRILYRKCKNQKTKKIRSWRNRIRKNWFSPKYKNQLWKADFVFYAHLWIIFCQLFYPLFPVSGMLPFLNPTHNTPFWGWQETWSQVITNMYSFFLKDKENEVRWPVACYEGRRLKYVNYPLISVIFIFSQSNKLDSFWKCWSHCPLKIFPDLCLTKIA